jgi:hypothetical protein
VCYILLGAGGQLLNVQGAGELKVAFAKLLTPAVGACRSSIPMQNPADNVLQVHTPWPALEKRLWTPAPLNADHNTSLAARPLHARCDPRHYTHLTLTGTPSWIAFLSFATSFWSVPSPCRKRLQQETSPGMDLSRKQRRG